METLLQDLRYGVRMLRRSPGFTAVAVLSLALGIGANTAIFSLIDQVVLRWLPVKDPEQLVRLNHTLPRGGIDSDFAYSTFEQFRGRNQSFSGMFASDGGRFSANIDGQPETVEGRFVSGAYHSVMGISAILGRTFIPEDDMSGKPPVAVISHGYWQRRFGLEPSAVGKTITLKRIPFIIVGVTPDMPNGIWSPDILVPMVMHDQLALNDHTEVSVTGRLKPGISEEQASADLSVLYQQALTQSGGTVLSAQRQREISAQRIELTSGGRGGLRQFSLQLGIMLAVVALVLMIACANVANLLLARATVRQKEIAVRLAVGAGRGRVVRQLLTESILLSTIAGGLGLILAWWAGPLLGSVVSHHPTPVSPDARILGFTAGVSILTGVIFGLVPAFRATRLDLSSQLKPNAHRFGDLPRPGRGPRFPLGKTLVVLQVALSLALLLAAGLLVRSLQKLNHADVGFNRENLLLIWAYPTLIGYEGSREINLYWQLLERMNGVPGVRSASLSRLQLLSGYDEREVSIPQHAAEPGEDMRVSWNAVAPKFFETLAIPLLLGRDFSTSDGTSAPKVALISESMARQYFKGENPVGKRFAFTEPNSGGEIEIVGVVKDIKSDLRDQQLNRPPRAVYVPFTQAPPSMLGQIVFELRTAGNPTAVVGAVRHEAQMIEKDLDFFDIETQAAAVDESLSRDRSLTRLSSFFSVLALLLASIGLYGTVSYSVSRRTNEIGIRMALGAQRSDLLKMVLHEGMMMTLVGVGIGITTGLALTRVIASQLYDVSPTDPVTFVAVSLFLAGVTLLASYIPARRAAKVDPMVALRYE